MLKSMVKSFLQRSRAARLRVAGVQLGAACTLGSAVNCRRGVNAQGKGRIVVGRSCQLENGVVLHAFGGEINLAENIFLGPYVVIYGHGGVFIGDNALVSMHCRIVSSNHTVPPSGTNIRSQPDVLLPTKIGRDVWLGAGVTVLGGVTIGDGCVIGAGAVVTHDLPAGSIAHGVPARAVGRRENPPDLSTR
jgi:acetyltransferase-like isoleucine patch superfamily enzyme